MATRFYIPRWDGRANDVSPAFGSQWERTTNAFRRLAATTKGATAPTSTTSSQFTKDGAAAGYDVLQMQLVSDPLSAQTISGTVSAVVRAGESASAADASLQIVLRVVSGDGSVERGVLYDGHAATLNATADALGQEMGTTASTRVFPAGTALSSVAVSSGDRLVIEIGTRHHGTNTAVSSFMQFGDASGTADHTLASGATTSLCPWVELSQDLAFGAASEVTLSAATAVGAAEAVVVVPLPVTVVLGPASASGGAVALSAAPGAVSVALTPGQAAGTAVAVTAAAGPATVVLLSAEASGLAGEVLPTPGAVLVELVAAGGVGLAVAVTPAAHVPGQVVARPSSGAVARPGGGLVARPQAGVVVRP